MTGAHNGTDAASTTSPLGVKADLNPGVGPGMIGIRDSPEKMPAEPNSFHQIILVGVSVDGEP